jgi:hypothetical protein
MREGAFALIDCLGFKGIWKRTEQSLPLEEHQTLLLEKLRRILDQIHLQLIAGLPYHLLRRDVVLTASLLSDSVAISLRYENDDGKDDARKRKGQRLQEMREKSYLVWLICASTVRVLDLYLQGQPGLVLRGCITFGYYEHNTTETGSFIVGPAVDDAAEKVEISQGAFVWLHPEAAELYRYAVRVQRKTVRLLHKRNDRQELLEGSKKSLCEPIMVDPYDVPLKGGGRLRCPVLNPLAFHNTREKRQAVFRKYEDAMSSNQLDVLLKRQYTMEFLKAAEEARRKYLTSCEAFIGSLKKEVEGQPEPQPEDSSGPAA